MSSENPRESGPRGPEQKEWQGQRWEYKIVPITSIMTGVDGLTNVEFKTTFEGEEIKTRTPLSGKSSTRIPDWLQMLEDGLNKYGDRGWEAVGIAAKSGFAVVLLKRLLQTK